MFLGFDGIMVNSSLGFVLLLIYIHSHVLIVCFILCSFLFVIGLDFRSEESSIFTNIRNFEKNSKLEIPNDMAKYPVRHTDTSV